MFTNKLVVTAVFALAVAAAVPQAASAGVFVSVNFAPPELPVYAQPAWPGDGYIWTPGYWGYGPEGYYWIPGTWIIPPTVGFLWTPGYWGWGGSSFMFHDGYWGQHVGFYGGVNYGFGYGGSGYQGGYWQGSTFNYNRSVNNISAGNSRNVYSKPVTNVTNVRVSYNGGTGGLRAQASAGEQTAARESHVGATNVQGQHQQAASHERTQLASVNHGQPAVAATPKPQPFSPAPAARQNQPAAAARQQERPAQAQQRPAAQAAARPQQAQQERPQARQEQAARPAPQPAARPQQPERQQEHQQAPRQAAPQQQHAPAPAAHEEHERR